MAEGEVSDFTDWVATPLEGLAPVEAALRCQMCKDFYKTPMLTACSHTFCSLCIRHALANDGRCPLCRKTGQESQLRNNWSLEEAVEAFSKSRKALLEFAKKPPPAPAPRSPKRKLVDRDDTVTAPETKRLRSSARLSSQKSQDLPAATIRDPAFLIPDSEGEDDYENEEDKQDDTFVPEDGLVPCPVCQTRMKQWQVFKHLDTCTGPLEPNQSHNGESSIPRGQPSAFTTNQSLPPAPPRPPPERLPTLSYSMLKEAVLRKKLSDLGISSTGPRQLLESRHREWITIWNANCDAARPKGKAALLQDLATWEKTIGAAASGPRGFARAKPPGAEIKDKDFNGAAWAAKHDTSFKDLIAMARNSRSKAQEKKEDPSETKAQNSAADAPVGAAGDESLPGVAGSISGAGYPGALDTGEASTQPGQT